MNVLNVVPMQSSLPPPPDYEHLSVMPEEVAEGLRARSGALFVDATVGMGGHAARLCEAGAAVIGIDRDADALERAQRRLAEFGDRVRLVQGRFSEIADLLGEPSLGTVDGLLADVGVSSLQLDAADRGMSFRREGPLDMRMDQSAGQTAKELIASLRDDELADVLYKLGEERRSRRVARCIKQAEERGELETTLDLRRAVVRAVGPARVGGVDPATKTFQALRIAVNDELGELEALLAAAKRVIRPGGLVAIISFHSLEDRIVKRTFRDDDEFEPLTKKPLMPSSEEVELNPRARSAKLRVARVKGEGASE